MTVLFGLFIGQVLPLQSARVRQNGRRRVAGYGLIGLSGLSLPNGELGPADLFHNLPTPTSSGQRVGDGRTILDMEKGLLSLIFHVQFNA